MQTLVHWIVALGLALAVLWSTGAIYFDVGKRKKSAWLLVVAWWLVAASILWCIQPFLMAASLLAVLLVGFALWWFSQSPSHEGEWDPCFATLPTIHLTDSALRVENLRMATYPGPGEFDLQYVERTYDLSRLQGVDALIIFWGSNWICHPMAIFDFGDNQHLCFSIEVRYRLGDSYAILPSIYRQHELMYVVCDERDAILRRIHYYPDEIDCYLYRLQTTTDFAHELLEEYVFATNRIAKEPKWYNAFTSNCTTEILGNRREKIPWDWRMLINGKFDQLLYEKGLLLSELPFPELKQASWINDRARDAEFDQFGTQVRDNLPGFSTAPTSAEQS